MIEERNFLKFAIQPSMRQMLGKGFTDMFVKIVVTLEFFFP